MTDFPTYVIGTVSVADAGTTVSGDGAIWSGVNARSGDSISIDGGAFNRIKSITDDTHLELVLPQSGAKSSASYVISQDSPLRFVGGQAMADVSSLIAKLRTTGLLWYLPDGYTTPDGGTGFPALVADDGQGILEITSGKLWVMQSGAWTFVGVQKALGVAAPWSSATTYNVNDVVSLSGTSYVCILANTNHTPPNATYWTVLAAKGDTGSTGPASLKPVAAWVTATAYVVGPPASFVSNNGSSYECLTAHTSGTFATDLAAGKWGIVTSKGDAGTGIGDMLKSDNLSGLADTGTALTNLGGTTVGKAVFVATDTAAARTAIAAPGLAVTNAFTDTTDATSSTAASTKFAGGVGIAKKLFVGLTATISGNFTANGTSHTFGANSQNTQIVLNGGASGASGASIIFQANAVTKLGIGNEIGISGTGAYDKLTLYSSANTYRLFGLGAGTIMVDSSGNISSSSDETLKIIHGSFDRGIAEIVKLQPITYSWNEKSGLETEGTYAGFSAQNVQSVMPEAVGANANGTLTLQDRAIIAALVNAVKSQQIEIDALKSKSVEV